MADLDLGFFRKLSGMKFKGQRKARSLGLTRERDRDDRSGAIIENVMG